MRRRAARHLVAAALLLATATTHPHAAGRRHAPPLTGPISDFWARVKGDWANRLSSLNHGPLQTAIWVAMVWDGPDDLPIEDLVDRLHERESRRWVRAQITRHRWSAIAGRDLAGMQAMKQHAILVGTPADNDLVARALDETPIEVGPSGVGVGDHRIDGDGLLVIFIAPNPVAPHRYALVMTGTSPESVLAAGEVPYGESDYIVYRGRRMVERGYFVWSGGRPSPRSLGAHQSFEEWFNWTQRSAGRIRLHYDPASTPEAVAARYGRRMDAGLGRAAVILGIDPRGVDPIDCYLYPSLDEKVRQTADPRPAHVDPATGSLHVVGEAPGSYEVSLAASVLIHRARGLYGAEGERELPGLALALSLAVCDPFETIPLAAWAARSSRDPGYLSMDLLLARRSGTLTADDPTPLDAAAFVRHLLDEEGAATVAAFYRTARRADFHERFRELFGRSLKRAESEWLATLPAAVAVTETPMTHAFPEAREAMRRRDHEAVRRLLSAHENDPTAQMLLARVRFREGRFDEAVSAATRALADPGSLDAADRAWARLTLGRSHAAAGRLMAATRELTSPDIVGGPEQVRVIADLWQETLGQPRNGRAAERVLMESADTDLLNYRWEEAEEKLRRVLAGNPENHEAHAALGQVYLSKYQYWYDWMLLDRELFPGVSMADPDIYGYLADKGRRELALAESLPFGEEDRWLTETGPVEPGVDQATPHFLLARARLLRGDPASARREIELALELGQGNRTLAAWCQLYLGRIAARSGDLDEARARFRAVVDMKATPRVTALANEELVKLGGG